MGRPIRVAIVNDYEIVVAGIAASLAPYADRVRVVELDSGLPVTSDVDIVLYDTFGAPQADGADLDQYLSQAKVVVFSWNVQPDLVHRAMARGVAGYLPKSLTAREIIQALERVAAGETVWPGTGTPEDEGDTGEAAATWPGREHGLTARESEVLGLIGRGYSNQEIAERVFLSINSVKTYIRTAYRKIGVTRRSQAVLWGIQHGLAPDRVRSVDDE